MPRLGTPDHPGDRATVALGGRGSMLAPGTPEEGGAQAKRRSIPDRSFPTLLREKCELGA